MTALRPTGVTVLRESFEFTSLAERRVRAVFITFGGADSNPLMDWEQSVQLGSPTRLRVVYEYVGAPTAFGYRQTAYRVAQGGRAVGNLFFVVAPGPLLSSDKLTEVPQIRYRALDSVKRETTWDYQFVLSEDELGGRRGPVEQSGTAGQPRV